MEQNHQAFFDNLTQALDADPPAARTGGKKGSAAGFQRTGFGAGVAAVLRGLLLAGVPWHTLLAKVLPVVIAEFAAGKKLPEILSGLVARWLAGEFGDRPSAGAGGPSEQAPEQPSQS